MEGGVSTLNGMGTSLYGRTKTPGGIIATKWIVFLFMPLLPVRSYVVSGEELESYDFSALGSSVSKRFTLRPMSGIGLHWPQVLKTAVFGWSIGAAVLYLVHLLE